MLQERTKVIPTEPLAVAARHPMRSNAGNGVSDFLPVGGLFMRVRISIVLAALAVAIVLPGVAAARGGNAANAAKAEQDKIIAYWTPARIAAAQPKGYVRDAKGGFTATKGKPPSGGGGAVTGASWTGNEPVELRVGRILFSSGGSDWICSGSVVTDSDSATSMILTAGHCVYDGADGWSYNFLFMPDFDDNPDYSCASRVMGCWTANRLAINSDFYPGGFGSDASLRVDYGFARVGAGNKLGQLDTAVGGGYGIRASTAANSDIQWAFGYPAEGRYKGKDLIYCMGTTAADPNLSGTYGMNCSMNGGSSGGGWIFGTDSPAGATGANRQLSSVNSYGYSGLAKMFGPKFNAETTEVMAAAAGGAQTSNTRVCTTGVNPPSC